MLIGSRQSPSLTINDVPVKQASHTKSLGVHIDENLTWNVHIEKLCKKVASGIGACIKAYKVISLLPQCNLFTIV